MKDSNAVPSSSNTPANSSARGKAAVPNAKNAKARAKAKNAQPKQSVAPIVTSPPAVVASAIPEPATAAADSSKIAEIENVVSTPSTPVVAKAENVVPKPVIPEATMPELVTPEILFPEVSTPKIVPSVSPASDSDPKTAEKKIAVPKAAPAKVAVSQASAPKIAKVAASALPVVASKRALPKMRPLYIGAIVAAIALTTAGGVAVGSYNQWSNSQQIAPKVRIAGETVGGLTRDEAIARLNKRFSKLAFTLATDDKNIVLGLADIGGKPSIELTVDKAFAIGRSGSVVNNFTRVFGSEVKSRSFMLPIKWNRGALTSRLGIVNAQYARPAVDARLVTVSQSTPRVTDEESGRALDVSATADAIQKSYFLGASKIKAVTRTVEPKVTAADLVGRDVKLGEYRTAYNSGVAGRTTNIHVACRAVDGQVFMPGEVLSFNGLTGERTYRKGYRMAHIFMRERGQTESQIVDGLAGGVCQVSSTLYNAVRKTNAQSVGKPLRIIERSSHSLPVTYVPPGRDATVAWPSKDFKFRNDNNFPIYVRTNAADGRLTISIWGRVPDNQAVPVSLEN